MRSGRGACMRFPDVLGKPVSSTERIAGSRAENGSGAAETRPCDTQFAVPVADGSTRPFKSTCQSLCASAQLRIDEIMTTVQQRLRSSSSPRKGPPLALNMLSCCRPAERLGGTSHYEGSTPGRGGKLNPMCTNLHTLSCFIRDWFSSCFVCCEKAEYVPNQYGSMRNRSM